VRKKEKRRKRKKGGWIMARRPSPRIEPSLAALQAWSEQRKSWPSQREWDAYAKAHGYLGAEALLHHRQQSWFALCDDLGGQRWQAQEQATCLEAVREAAKTLGPWMTKREYDRWAKAEPGRPRLGVVTRRCGGRWNETKALAHLPQNPSTNTHIWSEQEMLDALREAAKVLGDPFGEDAYESWRGPEHPSVETIRMHWGSLNTARAAVSLTERNPGGVIRYTEADWQQALRDFVAAQITGAQYQQWAQANEAPSLHVLVKYAGGFRAALAVIGLDNLPRSSMARDQGGASGPRSE